MNNAATELVKAGVLPTLAEYHAWQRKNLQRDKKRVDSILLAWYSRDAVKPKSSFDKLCEIVERCERQLSGGAETSGPAR